MNTAFPLAGVGDEAGGALELQIAAHRELGWSRLEVRRIGGRPITELGARELREAAFQLAAAAMEVPAVASPVGGWARPITCSFVEEIEAIDAALRAATTLGAPFVRVMSYPNDGLSEVSWCAEVTRRMRALVARAEAAGIVLLIENCAGWAAERPDRARELLARVDSDALGILFDTGNGVAHGYDGLGYLRELAEHVRHIHVKDAAAGAESVHFTYPGEGQARVAECLQLAAATGYRGCFSIEPELAQAIHLGLEADDATLRSTFIEYGRRFESLLAVAMAPVGVPAR
jgi:sugar phosphate isomerase/epimerase